MTAISTGGDVSPQETIDVVDGRAVLQIVVSQEILEWIFKEAEGKPLVEFLSSVLEERFKGGV